MAGRSSDVLVIGAGVIAKATALALSKLGKSVTLFAPRNLLNVSATHASGAMLGSFAEFTKDRSGIADHHEAELRIRSGRSWEAWFEEISDGGDRLGRVRRGTYIVASNNGLMDLENIEYIQTQADKYGEPNEWVDPRDVAGLLPHRLSRAVKVLSLPNEGYIDSGVLLATLDGALARRAAVSVVDSPVTSLRLDGDRPTAVTADGERHTADDVVVAAGVESANLLDQLGVPGQHGTPTLLGGRGVSIVVRSPIEFPGVMRTPNRDFACGSHVVPLGDGRTYLGATNRLEVVDFGRPMPSLGELHSICHSLANEINVHLRTASVVECRAGYRPISSDGYPFFGQTAHPNVFVATGTYRNGVLMAPVIADVVAREVCRQAADQENPFDPRNREHLFADRDVNATMLASLRQVVSFVQEPDGNLPFDRAAELERLLAAFLRAGTGMEGGDEVADLFERITRRYPISEAMPILMYEVKG